MASPEVQIFTSVRRFSDFLKDSIVNNVVSKMQGMNQDISAADMNDMVRSIENTFEQCNMNGFREVESAVNEALQKTRKTKTNATSVIMNASI